METIKPTTTRSYEDIDPVFKWRRDEGRDTIELHLPGMLHMSKLIIYGVCLYRLNIF